MAGISLSGLVSGSFDWKSVVDQLIQIESQPIARLQNEQADNIDKIASLSGLESKLSSLQTAANALAKDGLFNGRTSGSATANSGWTANAANDTVTGGYSIAVSQLATAARFNGSTGISTALNAAADDVATGGIAGLTLASLPTATAITGDADGNSTFTINGHQITINTADSLQSVFDQISTVTSGQVTASYDAATDKITLNSVGEIVLGAANDTSNFLSVMRLANSGVDGAITSSSTLGSAATNVPLVNARLRGGFGAVDGSGNGSFKINGEEISYNINTDSLSAVLARITASDAGVTASYDRVADRVVLANKTTGNVGIGFSDVTGSLMSALGIATGSLQAGTDAKFSVDGAAEQSSASNTLTADVLGVEGLTVTVNSETTQTINVSANTEAMKKAVEDFVTKFNDVQNYIDSQTKITKRADGKVITAVLSDNYEVQNWANKLRSLAFSQVSGLTGTINRLENLGIDFSNTSSTLSIKDSAKLDNALANNTADVAAFFNTSTSGFAAAFDAFLSTTLEERKGTLVTQMNSLNKQNSGIDEQISTLNRRLEQERERLTNAFILMQSAQSKAQQQQTSLTNMYDSMNRKT